MKLLAIFCLVAVAGAAPRSQRTNHPQDVEVLRYENVNEGNGRHRYYFEQSDGTKQEQQGELKNEGRDGEAYTVNGSYSWVGPDGVTYTVNYVADKDGYQPDVQQGPGSLSVECIASLCNG